MWFSKHTYGVETMGYPRLLHRAHKHDTGTLGDLRLSEVELEDLQGTLTYSNIKSLVLKKPQISNGCEWRRQILLDKQVTQRSRTHGMMGVGRDLWRSSSSTPLPKHGNLKQVPQNRVQVGFEYLQRRRIHYPCGQPVPVLLMEWSSSSSCSGGTSYASVCARCLLSCHWPPLERVWPHPLDTHPADIFRHL